MQSAAVRCRERERIHDVELLWLTLATQVTCEVITRRNVLQSVAELCSVLQCAAVCCSVIQHDAVCCSLLQSVAVSCSLLQSLAVSCSLLLRCAVCCSGVQRVAVYVAVRCWVMQQCVTVRACVRACARVCVHVCACACLPACLPACLHACVPARLRVFPCNRPAYALGIMRFGIFRDASEQREDLCTVRCWVMQCATVRACVRACMCAYVRARARACVRSCVPACVRACLHACMRVCMHARLRAFPCTRPAYALGIMRFRIFRDASKQGKDLCTVHCNTLQHTASHCNKHCNKHTHDAGEEGEDLVYQHLYVAVSSVCIDVSSRPPSLVCVFVMYVYLYRLYYIYI